MKYLQNFLKNPNSKWLLIAGGVVILLITVGRAISNLINNLFSVVGLTESESEKKIKNDSASAGTIDSPWSTTYYQRNVGLNLTKAQAEKHAKIIYSALSPWNFFGDDIQAVYGSIKSCQSKSDLSYISAQFYDLYQKDLYSYIWVNEWWNSAGLNAEEMEVIINYVNTLK